MTVMITPKVIAKARRIEMRRGSHVRRPRCEPESVASAEAKFEEKLRFSRARHVQSLGVNRGHATIPPSE